MVSCYGGAMMADMATTLSIEDCCDLLEVAAVDAHNRRILNSKNK